MEPRSCGDRQELLIDPAGSRHDAGAGAIGVPGFMISLRPQRSGAIPMHEFPHDCIHEIFVAAANALWQAASYGPSKPPNRSIPK